jgi:hypothetical protein
VNPVTEVFGVISGIKTSTFPLEYHSFLQQTRGDIVITLWNRSRLSVTVYCPVNWKYHSLYNIPKPVLFSSEHVDVKSFQNHSTAYKTCRKYSLYIIHFSNYIYPRYVRHSELSFSMCCPQVARNSRKY